MTLNRIVVDGATAVSQQDVDAAVADLIGSRRDLSVICLARDRVADLYLRKGYRLTRVDLPPQRIESGTLHLTATEGYVANIESAGLSRLGPSSVLARSYFEDLKDHRPTPWGDLERAVMLARAIPGSDVAVRVHASPAGPGAVEIVAASPDRRRFDVSLGIQHLGAEELGSTALFARFDANSFTRLGERTSVVLFSSTNGDQKVAEAIESLYLGSHGLRVEGEVDYGVTKPKGALAPLDIDGHFTDASLQFDYPLVYRQSLAVFGGARFDYINQKNDLGVLRGAGGSPVLFEDRLRILSGNFDLRWRPVHIPQLDIVALAELRHGLAGLGASQRGDRNLSRLDADPQATVFRSDLTLRWAFYGRQKFASQGGPFASVHAAAQWANHPLTAYEEFQIGNYTIGRGFDPGAASGDKAVGAQLEAGWRLMIFKDAAPGKASRPWAEPYLFYDVAHVKNLDTFGYSATDRSWGGGARVLLPYELQLNVAYAKPLDAPFRGAAHPSGRWLLTLARVFSFH